MQWTQHLDVGRGENSSEHHALCVLYGEYERPVVGAEGGVEVGQATAVGVGGEETGPRLDLQPGREGQEQGGGLGQAQGGRKRGHLGQAQVGAGTIFCDTRHS